jgi:hypothetical protein
MGGDSGSKTQTTQVDKRLVTGQGSIGLSSDITGNQNTVTVNTLDQGIVNHAIDLTNSVTAIGGDNYKALLGTTQTLLGQALDSVKLNTQLAGSLSTGAQQLTAQVASAANPNQPFIIAGVVVAIVFAIRTFGKG